MALAMVVACAGQPHSAPDSTEQPTTGSTATVETTTTTATDGARIVLRHNGLGVVSFGEPVGSVMEILTDLLGPPSWDEIQQSPDIDRSVTWGEDGDEILYIQFTTWDHFDGAPEPLGPVPQGPIFHYYLTKSDEFATEAGITIDSPVRDLVAAYPGLSVGADCPDGSGNIVFTVAPPEPEVWLALPIFGLLDGELDDQGTRIFYIGAGWDRNPC